MIFFFRVLQYILKPFEIILYKHVQYKVQQYYLTNFRYKCYYICHSVLYIMRNKLII